MKKTNILVGGFMLFSMFAYGCSQPVSNRPPQEVIRDAMKKFSEVSSYAFNASVDADFHSPQSEDTQNVKVGLKLQGAYDGKDTKDLRLVLKADPAIDVGTEKTDGSFEVRLQKDMAYFLVSKYTPPASAATDIFKSYLGKWYSIQVPPELMKQLEELTTSGIDSQLNAQQKQIKELYENTNFLSNPTLAGTDQINGETSTHFKAELDRKATIDFIKKVAEIQETPASTQDVTELEGLFDKLAVSTIELWVGNSSGMLNQIQLQLQSKQDLEEKGSLTLKTTLSDFGKAVTVEVPKDAVPFPILDFLLMGQGGLSEEVPLEDVPVAP